MNFYYFYSQTMCFTLRWSIITLLIIYLSNITSQSMNSRECKHLRKTSPLFSAILIFLKDPISREMEWPWSVQAFKSSSGAPTEVSDLPHIWHLKNKALVLTKRIEYLQYKNLFQNPIHQLTIPYSCQKFIKVNCIWKRFYWTC